MKQEYFTQREWKRKSESIRNNNLKRRLLGLCGRNAVKTKDELIFAFNECGFNHDDVLECYVNDHFLEKNFGKLLSRLSEVKDIEGILTEIRMTPLHIPYHYSTDWDGTSGNPKYNLVITEVESSDGREKMYRIYRSKISYGL